MKLLLTGATGKVGQNFLDRFHKDTSLSDWEIVALCHNRMIEETDRVKVLKGSLADAETVTKALDGVTHILHMAAVKESPDLAIDVSIKGMFLLLEEARKSTTLEQFVLISGDCAVGHIFHEYDAPITEASPRKAYQGCYALTKVMEEVMLEQYQIQYGLNGCILRAPWIMEKDDFKYALSFGPDQFGGPDWKTLITKEQVDSFAKGNTAPLMLDESGAPLRRNFVHVDDLVSAVFCAINNPNAHQSLFNISMNEPVDYGKVAAYLAKTRQMDAATIKTQFYSNWLDNSKARLQLNWQPVNDFEALIERAWSYERDPGDPRQVWYPG